MFIDNLSFFLYTGNLLILKRSLISLVNETEAKNKNMVDALSLILGGQTQ